MREKPGGCVALPNQEMPAPFANDANAPPMASLIGLDETVSETIRLFLEILGWATQAYKAIDDLPEEAFRIAFVDDHQFQTHAPEILNRKIAPPAIVVIGNSPILPDYGRANAKLYLLTLPLDIVKLENIVSEC